MGVRKWAFGAHSNFTGDCMSRKTDAVLFMHYSRLAGNKGLWIEWFHLVNKLSKRQQLWNAARNAYYEMMARHNPQSLRCMPTERYNDKGELVK